MNYGKPWNIPTANDFAAAESGYLRLPDESGCDYDNLIDYISIELLKWCGCGRPEAALAYLRDTLSDIQHRTEVEWKQNPPVYDGRANRRFGALPDGLQYIYLYWLAHMELTEHGGAVGGDWLSERGTHLLEVLRSLNLEEE